MGKIYSFPAADEPKQLKIGWSCYETIGVAVVNPRGIDPFLSIKYKIEDFCYSHSSPKEMHDFVGQMLINHKEFASRIKETILKICPQYKEMIDKLIVLI